MGSRARRARAEQRTREWIEDNPEEAEHQGLAARLPDYAPEPQGDIPPSPDAATPGAAHVPYVGECPCRRPEGQQ